MKTSTTKRIIELLNNAWANVDQARAVVEEYKDDAEATEDSDDEAQEASDLFDTFTEHCENIESAIEDMKGLL
jgi:hypothetical protein